MLETNGNCQKTALEIVKYEVRVGFPEPPSTTNFLKNLKPAEG